MKLPLWVKDNDAVAGLARRYFALRTSGLERVIFTATTGRSGTRTLATLLAQLPGCTALHEPYPIMNGEVLTAASRGDSAQVDRVYRRIKSINILRAAVGYRYYIEGNHLFLKTFYQQAIDQFHDRLSVVHLIRPATDVATSIYCLDHLPGTEIGDFWWLDYRAPSNVIQIAEELESDPEFAHPYYRGLWYWYEMELRFLRWRARYPDVQTVRFDTDGFNHESEIRRLLTELGIEHTGVDLSALVGVKEHAKADRKVIAALPPGQVEQMDQRFRSLLTIRGHDLSAIVSNGPLAARAGAVAGSEASLKSASLS